MGGEGGRGGGGREGRGGGGGGGGGRQREGGKEMHVYTMYETFNFANGCSYSCRSKAIQYFSYFPEITEVLGRCYKQPVCMYDGFFFYVSSYVPIVTHC